MTRSLRYITSESWNDEKMRLLTIQMAPGLLALYIMQDNAGSFKGLGPGGSTILQELLRQGE
jgi:hypothetical protein